MSNLRYYVEPRNQGGHVFDRQRGEVPVAYCPDITDAVRIAALLNGSEALAELVVRASS